MGPLSVTALSPPEAVEHFAIWLDPQHDIVCGGVVDEGALGVHKEHVRNPDLLYKSAIKRHAEVVGAGERQPLVLPVVPQIQGHGEVLGAGDRAEIHTPTHCGAIPSGNDTGASGLSTAWRRRRPRADCP